MALRREVGGLVDVDVVVGDVNVGAFHVRLRFRK
jgi:hypothetical protein